MTRNDFGMGLTLVVVIVLLVISGLSGCGLRLPYELDSCKRACEPNLMKSYSEETCICMERRHEN